MAIQVKQHIEVRGDNPLEAVMVGTNKKVYLVALLAIKDGVEAAVDADELPLSAIYAALSFYYDNEEAIEEALVEARAQLQALGARDSSEALAEIRKRQAKGD